MRKIALHLIASAAVILASVSCQNASVTLTRVDPFEKLLPETVIDRPYTQVEEVAAGEHATFQFALRGADQLKEVSLSAEPLKDGQGHVLEDVTIGFVDFVHVGRTTPTQGRDAIRSASGLYPDPIVDDGKTRDIAFGKTQPIWVSVNVPKDAAPGEYKSKVRVGGKGLDVEGEIAVKVYPVVLDDPTLWVTNWFNCTERTFRHFDQQGEMYSESYWEYIKAIALKMKECYQNTVLIPTTIIDSKKDGDSWSFDFTNFDKMVGIFQEAGVLKCLEVGHIGGRIGLWNSPFGVRVPGMVGNIPLDNPEAQDYCSKFIPALVSHIKEKGWYSIFCQHIADEPAADNYDSYVAIARLFKKYAPEVKIIEACQSHDLADIVDIWVPQLNFYADGLSFYQDRQKAGDEVWFYTCLAPQGNYANRFLEQPLLKTRLLHWINFRYGATGYLHWGFNVWREDDPWYESTFINTEGGNILPGGDSWIVYPGDKRLYGSIRFEAMRDGIADYTLLQMLARKDEAKAKEICRQTVYDWTTYDMSTDHFRSARHEILEALSK